MRTGSPVRALSAMTERGLGGTRMRLGWFSVVVYVDRIVSASHSST